MLNTRFNRVLSILQIEAFPFVSSLDILKAFDRVNHYKMYKST